MGDSGHSQGELEAGEPWLYLPMDHGMLLTGSVWSLSEIPQGRWAEGCSWQRLWRVVSSLLQGSLTWQSLVLTMVGNLELEGGSLRKQ